MEEKLKHILDSAATLFNRYGVRSVTMDDICRELGISKKTIYQFVPSKEDLVKAMLDYRISAVMDIFLKAPGPDQNAIDTLMIFSKMLEEFMKNLKANPSLDYDLRKYYPDLYRNHIEKLNQTIHSHIAENIRQGINQRLYRADLNTDLISSLFIMKIENLAEPDSMMEGNYSYKKMYKVMIENHIRGISNKKGVKYFEKHILGK